MTVTAGTTAEMCETRDRIRDADLVELRLDTVRDPDPAAALHGRRTPVIVTCRPQSEGGHFAGSEEERRAILAAALSLGAEYVDVEWKSSAADLIRQTGGRRIVLSHHDFSGTPADLSATAAAMFATGAEVVKLAVLAHRVSDCVTLRDAGREAQQRVALVAMGDAGWPTRIHAAWMGSCWTYAGDAVAPGQIPADELVHDYGFPRVTAATRTYGVVGRPIGHSLSPVMHNAAFRSAGIDAVYLPIAAADFEDFLTFAPAIDLAGASVTAPFKVDAWERADDCDPVSRQIGAINTLRRDGTRWLGRNTDVDGFLSPLAHDDLRGMRATVLGAGGAARSVVVALATAGAACTVSARRAEQAHVVASLTGAGVASWPPPARSWDLLVNATPIGTLPDDDASPLPDDYDFHHGGIVYDLVYNPPRTALLSLAERAGCRTIGGLDMLVAQAQAQFEWWTGQRASARAMRDAADAKLRDLARVRP